jgi:hypothetical protein
MVLAIMGIIPKELSTASRVCLANPAAVVGSIGKILGTDAVSGWAAELADA